MEEYRERHRAAYLARKNQQEQNKDESSRELTNSKPFSTPTTQSQPFTNEVNDLTSSPPEIISPHCLNDFESPINGNIEDYPTEWNQQEKEDEELAQKLQEELNSSEEIRPPDHAYTEQLIGSPQANNETTNTSTFYSQWDNGITHIRNEISRTNNGSTHFFSQMISSATPSHTFPSNSPSDPLVIDEIDTQSDHSSSVHLPPSQTEPQEAPETIEDVIDIEDDPDTAMLQAAIAKSLVDM